jgi:hypothetical protein
MAELAVFLMRKRAMQYLVSVELYRYHVSEHTVAPSTVPTARWGNMRATCGMDADIDQTTLLPSPHVDGLIHPKYLCPVCVVVVSRSDGV